MDQVTRKNNNSGQVLILGIVMLLILLFAVFFFFDIHNVLRGKLKLEIAEQSAALTAARWQAESLNLVGEINLLIATERVLLDENIDIPDHLKEEEVTDFDRGAARILALNEMQSRVTFIGPLIALAAAQQAAKNNGITPVKGSANYQGTPRNVADDFSEYQHRLNSENNIYSAANNININGYAWKEPYKKLISEIRSNGIAVRPNAMVVGIEGIHPAYLGDESLYAAIIACEKGYPSWCHWRLRQLVKMDDSYFEGEDWYTPDFSWIRFSQQSEIYPLELLLNPGVTSLYEDFRQMATSLGHEAVEEHQANSFRCKFYHYNHRWMPDSQTYSGPDVGEGSPWKRGIYLRKNVAEHALYGGATAYAECVERIPSIMSFKSSYSSNQAKNIAQGKEKINENTNEAMVQKYSESSVQVGGNYSVDLQNSGAVAKPIGALKNGRSPVTIPIVLPVFTRANLIPSTIQRVRPFSFNWPTVEKFVVALKDLTDAGHSIYDENIKVPEGSEYMLEALRLLGTKEFRRKGYNPDFAFGNLTESDLIKLYDKDTILYDPVENPRGPGWLQQPIVRYGRNYHLPKDALDRKVFYYNAAMANELNANRGRNEPAYVVPPSNETWMFYDGRYIRLKGNKFFDNMEEDPYNGCGRVSTPGSGSVPHGTNSGPVRL